MNIALIGASGQLGTDLQKVIPEEYLIKLDYPEFDITKKDKIKNQLINIKPDIIINTAAYNLVDQAEADPKPAMAVIGLCVVQYFHCIGKCKKEGIRPFIHQYSANVLVFPVQHLLQTLL